MKMSIWIVAILLICEAALLSTGLIFIGLGLTPCIPAHLETIVMCVLVGGLGGCTYCLRGVYLNACVSNNWNTAWLPWYLIRPIVSLIIGGISYLFIKSGLLLFGATLDTESSQIGILAIAFLAGLNVDKFVAKIELIGQTVWGIEPSRQASKNIKGNKDND